jgi:uncharacterized protein YjbI with pentapeptide repeats
MRPRPGFARLLPLMALTGLAAGTLALMASARPVQAPGPMVRMARPRRLYGPPVPAHGIRYPRGLKWELADFRGHKVKRLKLRGATFTACDFRGCDLQSADLSGARLWQCDFKGADLTGALLTSADLIDADLTGANLTGANLADANLTGATFDPFTRWPAGFDPKAHGARLDR